MQPNGCRSCRRAEWSGRQPCGEEGVVVTGLEWSWWRCWWKKWWQCWLLVAEEERRRKSAEGEVRPRGGCPYRRWGFGFVGRLSNRLLVEEKGLCGVFNGWRRGGERKRKEMCRNLKKTGFLAHFGPVFLLFQVIKPASIYRRWKRVLLSTPG